MVKRSSADCLWLWTLLTGYCPNKYDDLCLHFSDERPVAVIKTVLTNKGQKQHLLRRRWRSVAIGLSHEAAMSWVNMCLLELWLKSFPKCKQVVLAVITEVADQKTHLFLTVQSSGWNEWVGIQWSLYTLWGSLARTECHQTESTLLLDVLIMNRAEEKGSECKWREIWAYANDRNVASRCRAVLLTWAKYPPISVVFSG